MLSGTTEYPNLEFWRDVLPNDAALWNNYRNYSWYYDPAADPVAGTITFEDAADLRVDLCDAQVTSLGYRWVFSAVELTAPCLKSEATIDRDGGTVYVYRLGE